MIKQHQQGGNAMVYILIAIALFGALTLTLARQNEGADGQNISDEQLGLHTLELIAYVASAQQAVDMMLLSGSEINDLDFITPDQAAFNTPPHIHKVFHPQGGGLNYQQSFSSDIANDGASQWAINQNINIEWTPTAANDVVLTAYFIKRDICALINKSITGDSAIPATTNAHAEYFLRTGTRDLDISECADCDGFSALCVENNTGDQYSFYNIIAAQ